MNTLIFSLLFAVDLISPKAESYVTATAEIDIPYSVQQTALKRFQEESPALAQLGRIPKFEYKKRLKMKILLDNTAASKMVKMTLNGPLTPELDKRLAAVREKMDITYADYLSSLVSVEYPGMKVENFSWVAMPKMKYREFYIRLFEYIIDDYWYEEYCQMIIDANPVQYGEFDGLMYQDINSEMVDLFIKILKEELDKDANYWKHTAYIYQNYYYIKYDNDRWEYKNLSEFFDIDFHKMSIPIPDRPRFPDFELTTGGKK